MVTLQNKETIGVFTQLTSKTTPLPKKLVGGEIILSKDQTLGAFICTVCVALATAYTVALFWPVLEAIRLWLVAIPVLIAFIVVLGIGAWIGWTLATTPPLKPIEEIQPEENTRFVDK